MKAISNSDFDLIIGKLPLILRYARQAIPPGNLRDCNAHRMLTMMLKKLEKQYQPNKNKAK